MSLLLMCFSIIKGKVVFNDTKQRKKKCTHIHRHIIKCNIIDALFQIVQVEPRQKTEKEANRKKKKRDRVHAPRTFTRKHTMCLSLNLSLPRSVRGCWTRHTTSNKNFCLIAFIFKNKKKKETRDAGYVKTNQRKKAPLLCPTKKKGKKLPEQ